MLQIARRIVIAVGAFVIAWLAATLAGVWLFGSANFLSYVIAAFVAISVYLDLLRRDRRVD
jgi:uncharacterized membrane protein YesL